MSTIAMEKRPAHDTSPERLSSETFYTPPVDILEDHTGFTLFVDMPGVKIQDIDITFENGTLVIEGRINSSEVEERLAILQEYRVGNFSRSFDINVPISADMIKAELSNGELTLRVPKADSAQTRKVLVKSA